MSPSISSISEQETNTVAKLQITPLQLSFSWLIAGVAHLEVRCSDGSCCFAPLFFHTCDEGRLKAATTLVQDSAIN